MLHPRDLILVIAMATLTVFGIIVYWYLSRVLGAGMLGFALAIPGVMTLVSYYDDYEITAKKKS
jgi:hypothetical protein